MLAIGAPCVSPPDRLLSVWLYRPFPSLLGATVIFKPETLVRWHRSGFRLYWRWKSRRRVGRPAVPAGTRDLVRAISRDKPLWGAPGIHGELQKLGIDIAQSTVAKYMPRRRAARPARTGGPCCTTMPPTSSRSTFRRSDDPVQPSVRLGHPVWSSDGSSGPMLPRTQPPSGLPGKSPKLFHGRRRRNVSFATVTGRMVQASHIGCEP